MSFGSLAEARRARRWSQRRAAEELGVSQPYLSMLERGVRPLTPDLVRRATRVLGLTPAALTPELRSTVVAAPEPSVLAANLADLGYPGFAYLRSRRRRLRNPGELLLSALAAATLEARLVEALPWLVLRHADQIDPDWLVGQARLANLQNRLGFVVALARGAVAPGQAAPVRDAALAVLEAEMERSRLAAEDTFCQSGLPEHRRRWLLRHRWRGAAHWNLLTDWRPERLRHVA